MNRIKVNKNGNYTVINNTALRDKKLSLKAKGIFAVIMSLPENWDFSIAGIVAISKEGKTAIYAAIDELIAGGYCKRQRAKNEAGRFAGYDYTFSEAPATAAPCSGFPHTGNPEMEKPEMEKPETGNPETGNQQQLSKQGIKDRTKEINKKINKEGSALPRGFSGNETEGNMHPIEKKEKNSAQKEKNAGSLHGAIIEAYHNWYKERNAGIPPHIAAKDAAAVKPIISQLRPAVAAKNAGIALTDNQLEDEIVRGFQYILNKWDILPAFYQQQVQLCQISSNLNNIINAIKNPHATKQNSNSKGVDKYGDYRRELADRLGWN